MRVYAASFICLSLIFSSLAPAAAASAKSGELEGAKSALVMEQETGKILYKMNENEALPPASMTKVMTLLLIFKALSNHEISLKDKVTTSEYAASMGGSQIFLEPGEIMTVDEMLRGITIASANDASVAMAERVSGSEKAFVRKMNEEAKRLGLKHTHFKNTTGLPEEGHYTSAHDMAVMARELARYEKVFEYTSRYEDYLREDTDKKFWLVNTNKLVKTYPGADGLKTGFTNEAKYCLTATAKRNGMRVIAVVMGAQTPKDRNREISALMDEAFATYATKQLVPGNKTVAFADVNKGDRGKVPVATRNAAVLLIKKGQNTKGLKKKIDIKQPLQAPIKAGTVVGYFTVKKGDRVISKTPLVVNKSVNRASWWQLFKRSAGSILGY
ncbi:D-alanyl-D-alanine carboxypeptidase [Sporolactobacillus sp. THM7-7]|nr:D-alanyl-D-alanine carboxypeptidase [Sporolactobacillus sp. THM7-7]